MHRLNFRHSLPLHDIASTRILERIGARDVPPHTLMQRAGTRAAQLAMALAPHARTIWIACGPGNNGGDGLEAAFHLKRWGMNPQVSWLGDPAHASGDTRAALQRARQVGVTWVDSPPLGLTAQDLCIDALLGLGANRPPGPDMAQWITALNQSAAPTLAIDLPTGLDADTGHASPGTTLVHAQHTLSLLTLKPGLFTAQGRDAVGTLWFDDLGVATQDAIDAPPTAWLTGAPAPSWRPHASHKGSYGDVAVIGGEGLAARGMGMTGAALLAASAALHAGAGRVLVSLLDLAAMAQTPAPAELMFRTLAALDLPQLTVVCGCGGGAAVQAVLPEVIEHSQRLVLDADALNAIADSRILQDLLRARAQRQQATVLTPHPLEAARLLGSHTHAVQANRLAAAQQLAERFACVVILKGSGSVVAAPQARPMINPTGNARLATAGTGDVLAGLVGARLAQGLPAMVAATSATFQHGAVADAWPADQALTASALAQQLRP